MDSSQRPGIIPTNPDGVNKSQGGPSDNPGGRGHVPVGVGVDGPPGVTPQGTPSPTKEAGPMDEPGYK